MQYSKSRADTHHDTVPAFDSEPPFPCLGIPTPPPCFRFPARSHIILYSLDESLFPPQFCSTLEMKSSYSRSHGFGTSPPVQHHCRSGTYSGSRRGLAIQSSGHRDRAGNYFLNSVIFLRHSLLWGVIASIMRANCAGKPGVKLGTHGNAWDDGRER